LGRLIEHRRKKLTHAKTAKSPTLDSLHPPPNWGRVGNERSEFSGRGICPVWRRNRSKMLADQNSTTQTRREMREIPFVHFCVSCGPQMKEPRLARMKPGKRECVAGAMISFQTRNKYDFGCSFRRTEIKLSPSGKQDMLADHQRSESRPEA